MSTSKKDHEKEIVRVSKHGQATIPKEFRDKIGIDSPGKVKFRVNDRGEVVVEQVPSADEMQGFAARAGEAGTDKPASEILREKRKRDKSELEENFDE